MMHKYFWIVFFIFVVQRLHAQEPNLASLPDYSQKMKAWLGYCEGLRLNNKGEKDNYTKLQVAALRGLQLAKPDDLESRSQLYFYVALGYYYHVQFDSAQYYFYQSLHEAQKGKLVQRITRVCVALIPVNFQLQQPEKVEECRTILQSVIDTTKNQDLLQDGYYALGSYYQQKSYYSTAQDYFIKSLQLREKIVDTTQDPKKKFDYAIQCDMLSKLYLNTQMTSKSLDMLRQGMRFASVSPNVSNRIISSFVEAFTTSGNIDSAIYYNNQLAEATKNSNSFPSEIVSSNLNIAIFYLDHHEGGRALPFIEKSESLAAILKAPLMTFQVQMIKGRYFEETGKYDQAISSLLQALPVALQFSKELSTNILKYLALAEKGKGSSKEAAQYYEQYAQQADSLSKEKLATNFADEETRYQTSQKEQLIVSLNKENQLSTLQLQNASRTRAFLVTGLGALGIISMLLYFIYRNKERSNKLLNERNSQLDKLNQELAVANETKARLFGIISHDLRSPVSQIVQLMQLQKEKSQLLDDQSAKKHEERLKAASENVLEAMEDILLWSKSQMQHFKPEFTKTNVSGIVSKELNFLQSRIDEKNIIIRNTVSENFIRKTDENFSSVIIRNLLQNAVKYGDTGSELSISSDASSLYIVNAAAQSNAETLNDLLQNKLVDSKSSGLGLQIANDLANSIGVKIFFRQEDGHRLAAVVSWES